MLRSYGPNTTPATKTRIRNLTQRLSSIRRKRFNEIMSGRPLTLANVIEAVDLVNREPKPGVCCQRCLDLELELEEKAS